ncbi:MAG TPA: hypothetical protein VMT85_17135 [Thermoanaerobaculia bacterium]|nr:hypothetical protein [Thermoanaerobaculia bacterium]
MAPRLGLFIGLFIGLFWLTMTGLLVWPEVHLDGAAQRIGSGGGSAGTGRTGADG